MEEVALGMNRASLWHQAVWLWQVTLVQRLKISPLASLQGRTLTGPVGVHGRSAGPGRSQCDSMCRRSMHALPSCPLWPGHPCLHGEKQSKALEGKRSMLHRAQRLDSMYHIWSPGNARSREYNWVWPINKQKRMKIQNRVQRDTVIKARVPDQGAIPSNECYPALPGVTPE